MKPARAFIHGLESSGWGTKGMFFLIRSVGMIIEDFDGPFAQRMEKLEGLLVNKDDLILVGSSYGGLTAAVYAYLHEERVKKLILLAPALHLEPFQPYLNKTLQIPVTVFHGLQDEVVPLEAVQAIVKRSFTDHTFTALDDNHSLHRTFASLDWDTLLAP